MFEIYFVRDKYCYSCLFSGAIGFSVVWCSLSFHGYVGFHFLFAESLEESFVVVALWSHIVLISDYHGRLLLLHLF
jgi:hypothetical protein